MKLWAFCVFVVILYACQDVKLTVPASVTPSAALPPPEVTRTPVLDSVIGQQFLSIQIAWENSPHANNLQDNQLLPQELTEDIRCDKCHESKDGIISAPMAWWNPEINRYESVHDSNALCSKCHIDRNVLNHGGEPENEIHRNFECIDCHEPHSTIASCSSSNCHLNIVQTNELPPATPTGGHPDIDRPFCGGPSCHPAATEIASRPRSVHGYNHANVTCVACHDATGLEVGPEENRGTWVTWREIVLDGRTLNEPSSSHYIQVEVDCTRCHFSNNHWDLPTVTGDEFDN